MPEKHGGLVAVGETMGLLTATDVGPLRHARHLTVAIAGAESNVSIGVRRLGQPAAWIGRVGADQIGDLIVRELQAEGVTCRATRDQTAPTGLMLKERRTADVVQVIYHRHGSAGSKLCPGDLDKTLIASTRVLHTTGITLALQPGGTDTVQAAIDIAHAHGVLVSFDVNYRSALWSATDARGPLLHIAKQADVLFAGHHEAEILTGPATEPQLLTQLANIGPRQVILKRGSRGCSAIIDDQMLHVPAAPVLAVDPVGAGDAFVAGYLAELMSGGTPQQRLLVATTAGAFAASTSGDWEGLPYRDELHLLKLSDNVIR